MAAVPPRGNEPTNHEIASALPPDRVLEAFYNRDRKLVVVSNDFLLQSFRRDIPNITAAFDNDFADELRDLNGQYSQVMAILFKAYERDHAIDPQLRNAMFFLLLNAAQSFVAALQLVRSGFQLQPGMLGRGLIENLTTVCHLGQNPKDLAALQRGDMDTTKTLAAAKKVLPLFGPLYGMMSNTFVHVSHMHLSFNAVAPSAPSDTAVRANLTLLRISVYLLYVVSELAFFPSVKTPRFWKANPVHPTAYKYAPDPNEEAWTTSFLFKWEAADNAPGVTPSTTADESDKA